MHWQYGGHHTGQHQTLAGEVVTRAQGDVKDNVGRPCDEGQLVSVDPDLRAIALHLYQGVLKVGCPAQDTHNSRSFFSLLSSTIIIVRYRTMYLLFCC